MKWRRVPARVKLVERKNRSIQFKVELEKKVRRKICFCSNALTPEKKETKESSGCNIIETFTDAD